MIIQININTQCLKDKNELRTEIPSFGSLIDNKIKIYSNSLIY